MTNTATESRRPAIDVCLCTFRRPEQLRRMLAALVAQETGGRFEFAVHVVDNDAGRSGERVVREFQAAGHPVSYDVEPVQNISLARNRSLSAASGDWIATVDDDDCAGERWLLTIYEAAVAHGADVVQGRTIYTVPPGTAQCVADFHRAPAPPTGSTSGYVTATCNSLFRRSLLEGMAEPFDPRFGLTGGGDTDFFNRLRRRGCRMIFCREAVVHSEVVPQRARLGWILRRRFRHGVTADALGRPLSLAAAARSVRNALVLSAITAAYTLCGVFLPCGRVHAEARRRAVLRGAAVLLELAFLAGRIARAARLRYEEYAR